MSNTPSEPSRDPAPASPSDLQTSAAATGGNSEAGDDSYRLGSLPALRYRELPNPIPLRKMIGPSIILAGLSLGSGEFILWPYITVQSGFVFFWACLIGVATQYFLNLEIMRYTLATGESAITGFCRMSRQFAWVFLLLNILPWMIPAWAKGSAEMLTWLIWGGDSHGAMPVSPYVTPISIAGLWVCGLILVAGPVVYETVEKVQIGLVSLILVLVLLLAAVMIRGDAVVAMLNGAVSIGQIPDAPGLTPAMLLGALAFAGAGGTVNLGQSNYIKDKGYGMGSYIGRITSPLTGQAEPVAEFGYIFLLSSENMARWRRWWRATNIEHFFSFFVTCVICLMLLTLIAYSIYFDEHGQHRPTAEHYGQDMGFVWGQAVEIGETLGPAVRVLFLVMGMAILLTTEFGLLDCTSRISTDIVKVNWLRDHPRWSQTRLYYCFLWGTILLGTVVLAAGLETLTLFKFTSAMNGAVMFIYSMTLLWLNWRGLPRPIGINWWRAILLTWSIVFFGFFTVWLGVVEGAALWRWATSR